MRAPGKQTTELEATATSDAGTMTRGERAAGAMSVQEADVDTDEEEGQAAAAAGSTATEVAGGETNGGAGPAAFADGRGSDGGSPRGQCRGRRAGAARRDGGRGQRRRREFCR